MPSALVKYEKRRTREIPIGDENAKIRSLDRRDWKRVDAMEGMGPQTVMMWALAMLEDDGRQMFSPNEGETDAEFVARITPIFDPIPDLTKAELSAEIAKMMKPPPMATMVKN